MMRTPDIMLSSNAGTFHGSQIPIRWKHCSSSHCMICTVHVEAAFARTQRAPSSDSIKQTQTTGSSIFCADFLQTWQSRMRIGSECQELVRGSIEGKKLLSIKSEKSQVEWTFDERNRFHRTHLIANSLKQAGCSDQREGVVKAYLARVNPMHSTMVYFGSCQKQKRTLLLWDFVWNVLDS